ncbi:alginate export family protein [Rheinheimera sp.]|uniref:alginate export family protein n=1 Tax=Rheinheimera sp. TaxID=1869214 RepID=UPI0027B9EA2F|nr:alginate export family protein [Rheinheimera sp.]
MKKANSVLLTPVSLLALTVASLCLPAANAASSAADALKQTTVSAQFRYRLENVDEDKALQNATASTLRSRLTLNTGSWFNSKALLEIDNVSSIGGERYNSTVNGNGRYSVVADPTGTDINQAALIISPNPDAQFTLGRQRINLNNQRFIGSVGWRQNEQTFDGLRYQQKLAANWQLDLASLHNANRVFGPKGSAADLHGRFNLATLNWQLLTTQQLSAFVYDLDFDTLQARDSSTQGLDYSGNLAALPKLKWQLALASQTDAHQAPVDFNHHYHRVDFSYNFGLFTGKVWQERMAGDGQTAFQTPFATLHAFDGFADLFLTTPNSGVRDNALEISLPVKSTKLALSYHQYDSDAGSQQLGSEVNATLAWDPTPQLNLLVKLAQYNADSHAADTNKVWLMASYNL